MKRIVDEGAEQLNAMLTDEMIEQANALINDKVRGTDDRERYCRIWKNMFSISCRTRRAYQDFLFKFVDGKVEYYHEEGCFRD